MILIPVTINKEALFPFLIYNKPIEYSKDITLHPVTMEDIVLFRALSPSITVRKNSVFRDKKIIKMTYLDFLFYCLGNTELEAQYKIFGLSQYFLRAVQLLQLCCKDSEIKINKQDGRLSVNGQIVTPEVFDDLRRIIIIQNGIDFDIDEFLNFDTEQRLLRAQKDMQKNNDKVNIEDYIDSLVIAKNTTEEEIMHMTIRKFWRYVKRYQLRESYTIFKTGECSGMVTFKEPIKYWMISLDEEDKYKQFEADENEIKGKISG